MVVFFYILEDNNIIIKNYYNLDIDFLIDYRRYINFFFMINIFGYVWFYVNNYFNYVVCVLILLFFFFGKIEVVIWFWDI